MSRMKRSKLIETHPILFNSKKFTVAFIDQAGLADRQHLHRYEYTATDRGFNLNVFNTQYKSYMQFVYKPVFNQVVVSIFTKQFDAVQTVFSMKYTSETIEDVIKRLFQIWSDMNGKIDKDMRITVNLEKLQQYFIQGDK